MVYKFIVLGVLNLSVLFIMWSVVHFFTDNSVEIVPNHWFVNIKCVWPIKLSNFARLIEKRVKVNKLKFNYLEARY